MDNIPSHWLYPRSLEEAAKVQSMLAKQVIIEDNPLSPRLIAGLDVSNLPKDPSSMIYAAAVLLNGKSMCIEEIANAQLQQLFPYIPGFLGFREAPVLVKAYEKLQQEPDLLIIDGHGISHPRRCGIASHLGVLLNKPTIGVAKALLVGELQRPVFSTVDSDECPVFWKGKQIAVALWAKPRTNPLIISPGHLMSFETSVKIIRKCLKGYKLPEPTRQAHLACNRYRLEASKKISQECSLESAFSNSSSKTPYPRTNLP